MYSDFVEPDARQGDAGSLNPPIPILQKSLNPVLEPEWPQGDSDFMLHHELCESLSIDEDYPLHGARKFCSVWSESGSCDENALCGPLARQCTENACTSGRPTEPCHRFA
jgi:hypothetical protein